MSNGGNGVVLTVTLAWETRWMSARMGIKSMVHFRIISSYSGNCTAARTSFIVSSAMARARCAPSCRTSQT